MSYSEPVKPPTTLDEQAALLIERGLHVPDQEVCRRFLYDTSYYRFSGYARQFQIDPRRGNNGFVAEATLDKVRRIVQLDTELSLALLRCLGEVERVVKARFAYELAHVFGGFAFYLDAGGYLPVTPGLPAFIDKVAQELRRAKSPTVKRYAKGEDLTQVPVWVAFELLSFGTVGKILEYLEDRAPRDSVAASFSEQKATFSSTIHSLSVLRNRCAHHGQLWHRHLTIQTPLVKRDRRHAPEFDPQSLYPAFLATGRLLRGNTNTEAALAEVESLLAADPDFTDGILRPLPR